MEVNNIAKYFSYEILRRGYDYYKSGKVKSIVKLKDGYTAKVKGSDEYRVTIVIDKEDKSIANMECTCPYAEDANCKHMAAVLYCIKNNDFPVNKENVQKRTLEISNFEKFKKEYKKECYKLFHNRGYLTEEEQEDYAKIVDNFLEEGAKYIGKDDAIAYEIFEFFLMEIDEIEISDNDRENLFAKLFKSYKELLKDERLFVKLLAFVGTIYTIDSEEYYFEHKDNIVNLLYQYIEDDWQARDALVLLNKLDKNKNIYDYYKRNIRIKIVYINYYFDNKEEAIKIANTYLDVGEICDFLLGIANNEAEKIEILERVISYKKNYSKEKYFNMLLSIYKENDKDKYLDLLKKYFKEYSNIRIYHIIKDYYEAKVWLKVKKQYLEMVRDNSRLYMDICVEEEYYDELIKALDGKWIETINDYIDILKYHKPKELLQLYRDTILNDIDWANDRKRYQKVLSNFINFNRMPHGKEELKNIIKYLRDNYKNRKALQEEIDFYEMTYM